MAKEIISDIKPQKKRASNFELLRIISMLLIISQHYAAHGGGLASSAVGINRVIYEFLNFGGPLGVDCFFLLSGYFLISSKFSFRKLFKLIFEALFYSIAITVIFKVFNIVDISLNDWIKSLFFVNQYWFIAAYIGMYIVSPFVNKALLAISEKAHRNLVILLTIMISLLPSLSLVCDPYTSIFANAVYLYILGAYIKRCSIPLLEKKRNAVIAFAFFYILLYVSVLGTGFLSSHVSIFESYSHYYITETSLPMLLCAVSLFMVFKDLQINYNRYINWLASGTFGVYLIHDNPLVRNQLWELVRTSDFFYSAWMFPVMIITVICIFICCSSFDHLRQSFIEKYVFNCRAIGDLTDKMDKWLDI